MTTKRGRKPALTKLFEANIVKYKKEGVDGKPLNFDSYKKGFYNPDFERPIKKK